MKLLFKYYKDGDHGNPMRDVWSALLEDLSPLHFAGSPFLQTGGTFFLGGSTDWLIRYRFPKPILWGYKTYFERQTQAIRVHVKVLSTLGFLVTGTFQPDVRGSASGISHPSMRQCWGSNHQQTCNIPFLSSHNWLNGFFSINGFPNTNGAIDGTKITIRAPSQNEFNKAM